MPARGVTKEGITATRKQHAGGDQHYATPVSCCNALLLQLVSYLPDDRPTILDAGCGDFGTWGYAARRIWPSAHIVGVDIRPVPHWSWYDAVLSKQDFLDLTGSLMADFDAIVGNPPFSKAMPFIDHSSRAGCQFFLLPLAFLESVRRARFWGETNAMVWVLSRRPSWWLYDTEHKGDRSTNSRAYAGFLFPSERREHWPLVWQYDEKLEALFTKQVARSSRRGRLPHWASPNKGDAR